MEVRTQTPTLKESTIVERVARIVSSVRGTKPDYTHLAAELEPALPFDIFGVVLLRHDRQAVRVTVCQREGGSWLARHHQHPLQGSMVERLLSAPETMVQNYPDGLDGTPDRCGDALSGCRQLRATFIAPLIAGNQVLGTLELGSVLHGTYEDEALQRLIGAVVHVLAAAIESAQIGGSADIQDRQRQALKVVSSALTSKMDLSAILNQIVEGIAKALNVASAIVTFDQRGNKLLLEAQSGLDPAKLRVIVARKGAITDQSILGYTLRRRQPCVSHDINTDERFPASRNLTTELGIHSIFSYPLVTDTTVYGALLLCSPEPGGFTPLKADILSLFASQATIAIHNGMLIESAHQRSRFQQAIEQLEQAYEQNTDEQEVLARVRRESKRTFGVSFNSLLHFISDHLLTRNERDLHAVLYAAQQEEPEVDTWALASKTKQQSDAQKDEDQVVQIAPVTELASASDNIDALQESGIVLLTQTAESALARAEILSELSRLFTQLKQSSDHIKDAWFVVDLNGLCIYMNPAAEVFCGMHMSTATESTIEDVFGDLLPHMRNAEEVRAYLHDFSQDTFYRHDLRYVLAVEPEQVHSNAQEESGPLLLDGTSSDQYYQLARYPLFNQHGVLLANVLQVHDVTAQVRDEKNKSALLSSVSHDLRTPLTTIKAAVTGLLQNDVEWDEQTRREILEDINAEADHLGVLVNALVEMSRIEMEALVLDKEWCDIVEVVHGAMLRLERILARRPVRMEFQPNLPLIYADHVQLERVFYNLIENAVHQSQSNAAIVIAIDVLDEDAVEGRLQYLRVKLIDYGYTMPASESERIFKTFYNLNLRGSGLGMAIARGIIEAHQGHIGVLPLVDGNGTCFFFTLPVHSYHGTPSSWNSGLLFSDQGSNSLRDVFPASHSLSASIRSESTEPTKTEFIAPILEEQ